VSFWGRDKRVAIKGVPDGLKDVFAILTGGGDITANATEALGACKRTKSARHLLFHFHHPHIPFPLIVVCALLRRIDSPGEIPGRRTVVPAGSPWGDSGGDEWVEALQEKAVFGRSVNHAGRSV